MKTGLTLVELLIVMGVMGVVMGAGLVNFRRTARMQTVEGAGERVRQALVAARTNAAAGRKDCGVCGASSGVCGQGDVSLQGWRVVLVANPVPTPDVLRTEGICSPVPYPTAGWTAFSTQSENLPEGVNMTTTTGAILFRPGGGGVYPGGMKTVTISDNFGNSRMVRVDGSGEVQ